MQKNSVEAEIANYIGKLLRDNFGKGPGSVYVSIKEPFITIYLKEFIAPMEKVLLKQKSELKVEETRDVMMNDLAPDIKATLRSVAALDVADIYYDWSLSSRTGIIFASINTDSPVPINDYQGKAEVHEEVKRNSIQAEKAPDHILSSLLNARTLVIVREGVLVDIEKELIANGFIEELKLSKRKLEKRLLNNDRLKAPLAGEVEDIFVDWDFDLDLSYIILIIKPDSTV